MKGTKQPAAADVHVGARIREARLLRGMSQQALADAIGLTFQQAQKYELAINRVSASRLHQIARVLERPVAWFFEGIEDGVENGGDPVRALSQSSVGIALATAWRDLPDPKLRMLALHVVQALAEGDQEHRREERPNACCGVRHPRGEPCPVASRRHSLGM